MPPPAADRLQRSFFRRDPITVARELLGCTLVRSINGIQLSGRIVETEAYLGVIDAAAHTYRGRRTARNESMYLDGGHVYVYFTYGMHHCVNVVAGVADEPVAVLLRAIEPVSGLQQMRLLRPKARTDAALCSGPGKLCQALSIDRTLNGTDLTTSDALFIEPRSTQFNAPLRIDASRRIGVDYAGSWARRLLRFTVRGSEHVSQ
jgi:DNA-3-methyladenine glycosylase